MTTPIVFFDIAGEDDGALRHFYDSVFGWSFDADSKSEAPVVGPLHFAVRKDPAEKRLYMGVPDVAATLAAIDAAGGSVEQPRMEVPGVVVLGLFRDPAGNPMGLVEMDGERPRVP